MPEWLSGLPYFCLVPSMSKYWIFQILGWLLFFLFSTYIALLVDEFNLRLVLMNSGICLFGIGITHLYRTHILRYAWQQKALENLLGRVVLAILILTLIFVVWYYVLLFMLYGELAAELTLNKVLASCVSIFILFVLWNTFYFMWSYIENSRRNLIEKLKMESELKDMEIRTLRANLQPHFIFNALNSIRALIDEDPALAREAVTRISNILRNSISKQQLTDTLENELLLTDDYLALEKIRFEERLQFEKRIDPNTLSVQIPTMMLQTLVENAIKHGISKLERGGIIRIEAEPYQNNLRLQVFNTGELARDTKHPDSLGFGLQATERRLQHIYGEKASCVIRAMNGEVCAEIQLPLKLQSI